MHDGPKMALEILRTF